MPISTEQIKAQSSWTARFFINITAFSAEIAGKAPLIDFCIAGMHNLTAEGDIERAIGHKSSIEFVDNEF